MAARDKTKQAAGPAAVLLAADAKRKSIPVWLARNASWLREAPLTGAQKAWVEAQGFKGNARKHLLLPGPEGTLAGAVLGLGETRVGDPMDKPELAVGFDEICAKQQKISRLQHITNPAQERERGGGIEVPDVRAEQQHEH